jgi:hypothetical protein
MLSPSNLPVSKLPNVSSFQQSNKKAPQIRHAPPLTTQSSRSERCSSRCFLRPWNPHIQRRKLTGSDSISLEFRRCVVNRLDPAEEIGDRLDIRNPFPGTLWMRSAAIINASENVGGGGWGWAACISCRKREGEAAKHQV